MRIINNSKDITTLEVGDKVVFGDLEYFVGRGLGYFLNLHKDRNDKIFKVLNINKRDFIEKLGIDTNCTVDFPETKSLEALTAIVSALFKEYEKQNELPKTWEEFCKNTLIQKGECLINAFSEIKETISVGDNRDADADRTYFTSKQEAKAFIALMQLRQLRKCYIGDWEPNWNNAQYKYCIICDYNQIKVTVCYHTSAAFSFPTEKLANQFLNNFKDLLEIAKPLL